ncbi:MAG: SdiA-regulated domain-containing protein [Saprospirales bacterium]|jgi:uncharacterized protein YjiK|nr:SdiA-regulated domain-containing protein [Saprospirales bacterium]MBK8923342.1 SdiA-regulated domain-containing protein [Saprospirales bacterium]
MLSFVFPLLLALGEPAPRAPLPVCLTDSLPYQLAKPSVMINLVSEELREISGLSPTGQNGVFCAIADERGEIFFIDGDGGGAILQRVLFRDNGDFEGLEKVGKCLYAVKSDGDIFEVRNWNRAKPRVTKYKTGLSRTDDVEGLGYDRQRHALLVAAKGNPDSAGVRAVYAFGLASKKLLPEPAYSIDPVEVNNRVPYHPEEKPSYFSPSGVAVHPVTGDIYVISTAPKRLVVLDYTSGKIRYAVRLNKKILPQPEGIAFDAAGNLYLSSEGKKGEAQLLRFDFIRL